MKTHKRHNRHPLVFSSTLILLLTFFLVHQSTAQAQSEQSEQAHFETMAEYLTRGSGKWTGENKNYDASNPRSPKAFGLWFDRPLKNLLNLKIMAYVNDSTITSSEGIFSWHPVKQHFVHITADRGNGYSEGVTAFPNDSTFISTMIIYRPDGKFYHHKDENFIVDENTHRNTSYSKDDAGAWVEKGNWTWTRDLKQ